MRKTPSTMAKALAWGVHLYTATGLIIAAGIAVLIVRGTAEAFFTAFALMWVATVIDATDGVLARRWKVKEAVPEFDGRRLDDLTDFLTYTCLPLLLIWRANLLPASWQPWLLFPLLASAYGFCQADAKTDDGYFLGFPSYWNLVAFYLYVLHPAAEVSLFLLLGFAALTFVPLRYLYSTQPGRLNQGTNVLAAGWAVWVAWILYRCWAAPDGPIDPMLQRSTLYSLAFPAYYLITSWIVTWQLRKS